MNKLLEVLQGGINQDATKEELKQLLKQGVEQIDRAIKYLQSVDPQQFTDSLGKRVRYAVKKTYDEGKLSEESVESMRKTALIFPSEVSNQMCELYKSICEFGKQMQKEKE